jgi:osmotically-inducible protein OsmY
MKTEVTSDLDLRQDIEEELTWDSSVDARRIGVAVLDGIVTLTGEVTTYTDKWRAERAVERVKGVRGIANEIEVKLAGEHTDTEIAKRAADKLQWNLMVPDDRVTLKIDNGWVTLKGDVEHDYQRRAAERAVRDVPGVKGVSNLIIVKPRVEPKDIKQQIEATFKRQAALDAENVTVEVDNGTVTLRGTVRSWAERREAEKVASAAPGARSVRNLIAVKAPA